jgi:hypothetical protein
MGDTKEKVILIDENDAEIGLASKLAAHRRAGLVSVFNEKNSSSSRQQKDDCPRSLVMSCGNMGLTMYSSVLSTAKFFRILKKYKKFDGKISRQYEKKLKKRRKYSRHGFPSVLKKQ